MKCIPLITALLLTVAAAIGAPDEHLDTLKVGDDVYKNVTVTRVSVTDIYFTHSRGMGNTKLKNLTPEMQKHFGFDGAKAKAIEQARHPLEATDQYHFRVASATNQPPQKKTEIQLELDDAMARVRAIVNQPVTQLPFNAGMAPELATYPEGWFHAGAITPKFYTVDVRKSVELNYAKSKYVTSSLNPGVVFLGSELEFNSQTKYFYTDRSLPKKKLTEAEMVEINRLYRIIAQDQLALTK